MKTFLACWEHHLATNDPLVPPPTRWGWGRRALGSHTAYAGGYEPDAFESLADFRAFVFHSSSAQQALYRHGPKRRSEVLSWYAPTSNPPGDVGLQTSADPADDVGYLLMSMVLPKRLQWLQTEDWLEAELTRTGDELLIIARTSSGFVTVFTVRD